MNTKTAKKPVEIHSSQLQKLTAALLQKQSALISRRGVFLLHDNARPHTAKATKEIIKTLGWEVLPHPPYSSDGVIPVVLLHIFT